MSQRNVVVGVAGGIAAYKACHLIRDFKEAGDDVRVVPTANALKFVGAATFEALSGHPVDTGVFERVDVFLRAPGADQHALALQRAAQRPGRGDRARELRNRLRLEQPAGARVLPGQPPARGLQDRHPAAA